MSLQIEFWEIARSPEEEASWKSHRRQVYLDWPVPFLPAQGEIISLRDGEQFFIIGREWAQDFVIGMRCVTMLQRISP